ncbi:MAG: hypothetical protein M8353_10515, partial [ANME-2 cluster archaeon]|nr:hypothetical protein [ANME-2 cluster archaeon]
MTLKSGKQENIIDKILPGTFINNNSGSIFILFVIIAVLTFIVFGNSVVSATPLSTNTIPEHDDLSEYPDDRECINCHLPHQQSNLEDGITTNIYPNYDTTSQLDNSMSLSVTTVSGDIILISSIGQNWYQQGINGLGIQTWGWTFFDETYLNGGYPSNKIIPPEQTTQRNNIYALLLDSGNNSTPIKGAQVTANITYWMYNGTDYFNSIVQVNLTEDTNHSGFYNGVFYFKGGPTTKEGCSYCHLMHAQTTPQLGYFPGNYTVNITAQADNKMSNKEIGFEVTPWGCEDCHGSPNPHKSGLVALGESCYICHGLNDMGHDDAGNPHQNTAHRSIDCSDCHTNKRLDPDSFNGINFTAGGIDNNKSVPQYNYTSAQMSSGTHSNLACTDCHKDLSLPNIEGNYQADNYTIENTVNNHTPSFASIQNFQDYYVINVTSGGPLVLTLDWDDTSNIGFFLYPPGFSPDEGDRPYYNGSTFTNKPEIYTDSNPLTGNWLLAVYGYDFIAGYKVGELQTALNYTLNSTYPVQQKNLPQIPECNDCHNSTALGGAYTEYEIPDWNPGFAHVDIDNDGVLDIQCRMCHNAMHDITVRNCQNCHTIAPANHPALIPEFLFYPADQCLSCHGDPHEVTGGGGPNCIACHDIGDSAIHLVDVSVIVSGIHGNLNNITGDPNEACWGCHQTNGNEPSGMGDRYNTPYICTDCHLESSVDAGIYGAPIVAEHFKNGQDILVAAGASNNISSCLRCHQNISDMILPNLDAENGTFDTDGNGIFGGPTNPYHYGRNRTDIISINETNCSYCHQSISEFDEVFLNPGNIDITHDGGKSCYICHRETESAQGRIHDSSLVGGGGGACIECHSVTGSASIINETDLGRHININITIGGIGNLTSEDCIGCHFDNPHSGPDATNTYYCIDCHTTAGTGPSKSSILFEENKHGRTLCIDCHLADGTYHQEDPRGSVANILYVNRYNPGDVNVTDCIDCHYGSNLDDAPFYAPGAGSHITSLEISSCRGCHAGQVT